ncbi:MAG: chitobiase/beta-hexosaminidase C-terminal domain-containing protein, partial [Sedimentisphaerales bacterium]|nr:chitobiase/beta-hexosaminidase C-terminal domain-containing protein [Sedimentisphaerales bacterium]
MYSFSRKTPLLLVMFLALLITIAYGEIDWTAYNDCIDSSGGNTTTFTDYRDYTGDTSGLLKDYATGSTAGMPTVTFSIPVDEDIQPVAYLDYGSIPYPGTDAYEIFNNKINFSGTITQQPFTCGTECWFVEIKFTNLNPSKKYTFVGSAFRNKEYTDRITQCTIQGADAFTNNSSDGVLLKSGDVTKFLPCDNSNEGYVVRWDDIESGSDGEFIIYTEAAPESYESRRANPLHGFMLQQIDDSTNTPPEVNAGQDQTINQPQEYLTLTGSASDDGLGNPNGYLGTTWSQLSGPANVEFITDIHQPEVTARFPATGSYELQLSATDGALNDSDEVMITVDEPTCPVGDIDGDCIVTLLDLDWVSLKWLDDTGTIADLDGDKWVTLKELSLIAQSWLDDWTGSVQVTILPAEAVAAGAQWRVDGGSWQSSGATVSSLPEGSHDVEYSVVSDWSSPMPETVQITRQQTTVTSGQYSQSLQTLTISEFMAVNSNVFDLRPAPSVIIYTQIDGERAYDDWIELKNMTDETISLQGWYLTDNPDNLTKWQFPAGYSIPGQGHLVVYASNKDIEKYGYPFVDDLDNLHTNFDLSIGGEYLALVEPNGITVVHDYNDYPKQRGLVSYGFASDDPNNVGYLTSPTLGSSNSGIYDGVVGDTKFSVDRGFYDSPFTVEITCLTPGAQIRYTTDNSEPTATNGTVYSSPVSITTSTCLRAAAFKSGYLASNIDTQTYIFLDDVVEQATNPSTGAQVTPAGYPTSWGSETGDYQVDPDITDPDGLFGYLYAATIKDDLKSIPTISVVVPIDWLFGSEGIYINQAQDGTERAGSVELLDPNGIEKFHTNCAVRMQGGAGDVAGGTTLDRWKCKKLSLRLMFRGIFGGQLKHPLFGPGAADSFNTIVLDSRPQNSWVHSDSLQRTRGEYVRDQMSSDTQLALGSYACYGRPVHVYLNGLYWGMYWMHERPDSSFAASYLGGDKEDYDVIKHVWYNAIDGSYDDYIAMFNISASSPDEVTAFENLKQKLDVPDFIDYMITNYYLGNGDWDHKNWYATHNRFDPAGRWRWHMWDGEHVMSSGEYDWFGRVDNTHYKETDRAPTGLHWDWINNDEYRMMFADRVHKHFFHNGPLTPDNFMALFNNLTDWIDRAIVGESARWGDYRGKPPSYTTPYTRNADWVAACDWIRYTYNIPDRRDVVLAQFTSEVTIYPKNPIWYPLTTAPEFYINSTEQYGGYITTSSSLTMSNGGSDTIWYTLDGTDPRLPGGAVNTASAVTYTSAITLTKTTPVKARAKSSGGEWSALADAAYVDEELASSIRVTELMYHPAVADVNTEFIELQNVGSETINLNLIEFTKGV